MTIVGTSTENFSVYKWEDRSRIIFAFFHLCVWDGECMNVRDSPFQGQIVIKSTNWKFLDYL